MDSFLDPKNCNFTLCTNEPTIVWTSLLWKKHSLFEHEISAAAQHEVVVLSGRSRSQKLQLHGVGTCALLAAQRFDAASQAMPKAETSEGGSTARLLFRIVPQQQLVPLKRAPSSEPRAEAANLRENILRNTGNTSSKNWCDNKF